MERYEEIERSIIKTYRKNIWRKFVKGINPYRMINEGDNVAICISGRASSFLMAKCAQEIQRHGVVKFGLRFICKDNGFDERTRESIENNAKILNIPLEIFSARQFGEDVLLNKAQSLGCNKIALGHHFDDVIETILSNMIFNGRIASLMPKERRGAMEIIRPMHKIKEKDINAWMRNSGIEFLQEGGERDEIKALVKQFRIRSPYIDKNIFNSVQDVNLTTVIAYRGKGKNYNFLDDYEERGNKNAG